MILIRGTSLTGFVDLVDELGGEGERLLREAGLDPAAVGDFGAFIPDLPLLDLLERAGVACLEFQRAVTGLPAYPQADELVVTVCCRVLWMLIGRGWQPVRVDLAHRPLAYRRELQAT